MKYLLALLFAGCGIADALPTLPMPGDCINAGGQWLLYDCPSGVGTQCMDDKYEIRAYDCILRTPDERIYCVAICE